MNKFIYLMAMAVLSLGIGTGFGMETRFSDEANKLINDLKKRTVELEKQVLDKDGETKELKKSLSVEKHFSKKAEYFQRMQIDAIQDDVVGDVDWTEQVDERDRRIEELEKELKAAKTLAARLKSVLERLAPDICVEKNSEEGADDE